MRERERVMAAKKRSEREKKEDVVMGGEKLQDRSGKIEQSSKREKRKAR